MPLWRSKYVGWIALEGLIRQKDIPCEWELIICEEPDDCLGEEGLMPYRAELEKIGCKIKYVPIPNWIPLNLKCIAIAKESDPNSKYYIFQAGDCFSQPYRLSETYKLFLDGADYVESLMGYFYLISENKLYLVDYTDGGKRKGGAVPALNMATKTHFVRELPLEERKAGVDGWIVNNIRQSQGRIKVGMNPSDHWSEGFDTHGLNLISGKRREWLMKEGKYPFIKIDCERYPIIEDIIDRGLVDRMQESYRKLKI